MKTAVTAVSVTVTEATLTLTPTATWPWACATAPTPTMWALHCWTSSPAWTAYSVWLLVGSWGGGWEDVPPPAGGALTVNAGDLITLLSGGRWVSPLHRVRVPRRLSRAPPPAGDDAVEGEVAAARGAGGVPARLSLVFFTGPPAATVVRPVVGAAAASGGGEVVAGEWLAAKLRRTNLVGGGGAAADAAP